MSLFDKSDANRPARARRGGVALCIMALLAAGSMAGVARAGDVPPRLAALLEKLPAEGPQVQAELLELGPDDIAMLCTLLTEPGPGTDAQVRYALHGLALGLGQPAQQAKRRIFTRTLAEALSANPPVRDPAFLIEQLELSDVDAALDVLAQALRDEQRCDNAARALLALGGPDVARVLRGALPEAAGQCRIVIIDGLGRLADTDALPAFLEDATSDDRELRLAALYALASSGAAEARDVLLDAVEAESWYERSRASDFLMVYAACLVELDRKREAAGIYRDVFRERTSPGDTHLRCAALYGLSKIPWDQAARDVLAGLDDENPQVRAAAANAAVDLPGPENTRALMAAFDQLSPVGQVAALDALTRRGDAAALKTALAALQAENTEVQMAAVAAAAELGRTRAVRPLVTALSTLKQPLLDATRKALIQIPGADATAEIMSLLPEAPPEPRAHLIEVLAARPASGNVDSIVNYAGSDDSPQVRLAALRALRALAGAQDLPALLELVLEARADNERDEAGHAVTAACLRSDEREAAVAQVLAALAGADTPVRCVMLRTLGKVGGGQALEAVLAALPEEEPRIREAGVRAFNDWPDDEPAPHVIEFARDTESEKLHVLALRAYARMIGLNENRPAEKTLEMCAAALETARRPDEKKLVLARLGDVKEVGSLEMLKEYLDDEALGAEAAAATLNVLDAFIPARAAEARKPLEQLLAGDYPEHIRKRAGELRERLEKYEGYITTEWWVAGPYMMPDKEGNALFDVPFPPEQPGAKNIEWRRQPPHRDGWFVELHDLIGGDHRVGYLFTRVHSPRTQKVRLEVGSDDGIKIWLNGEVVHANNVLRGCDPASDKIDVTLNEGWNTLLMKITNTVGGWAACARFRALDGGPLDDVRAEAGAAP